jgi:hypothetical protein
MTQPLTRPAGTGGGPPIRSRGLRLVVVGLIALFVFIAVDKLVLHHRNRYESTADAITKAIAKNDMTPVLHAFNAIDRPQLEDRGRVGRLSDMIVPLGAFKGSREDTPQGSPAGYHHFTERFDKGTLSEKYLLDDDGKITKFHIGPTEAPTAAP